MINKTIIINCGISDLDELQDISVKTFVKTIPANIKESDLTMYVQARFGKKVLKQSLSNPDSSFYIAKLNEKAIGYLKINFGNSQADVKDPKGMEIERINIFSEHFGKNTGKMLLDKALESARMKNLNYVWLGVCEKNRRAIRFYEKNGFVRFGNHSFKFGNDTHTDILMKLVLS
ncbi:MAG: GNAT family N-acetyltransferase [Ignavibacteriaceae bacterium]